MLISILIPCRNEAAQIQGFISGLFQQRLRPEWSLELLVADGRSDDGTRELLDEAAADEPRLQVIDNPRRCTPAALNLAIRRARGDILVRMDVHTEYAQDYVLRCVETLLESGADCVGGPWVPRGDGVVSAAIALSFASPWVSGGGKAHDPAYEGPVDTVYLGCWRSDAFHHFGLFDEMLVRAQDSEMNLRIWRQGGSVWQSPRIRSWYKPRNSLDQLFRQYTQYGYWKIATLKKHRVPASVRQLAPGAFLAALSALGVAAPFSVTAAWTLASLVGAYLLGSAFFTAELWRRSGNARVAARLPAVFACFHFGFGYGYLRGIFDFFLLSRPAGSKRFEALTRV